MASITIRNIDSALKEQLRVQAAQHGRSMEAEARTILAYTLNASSSEENFAVSINKIFAPLHLESFTVPPRQKARNPPDFGE